jgi:hypothetical protein
MLDFNNPQSENIFTASEYIGKLKSNCYEYVLMDFADRQQVFLEMISTSEELSEFSETAFPESLEKIKQLCDEIILEVNRLKVLNETTEPGKCNLCNGELSFLKTYDSGSTVNVPLCKDCSRPLIRKISELERPTGVWAI